MSKFNAHLFWLILIIIFAVAFIGIVYLYKSDIEKVPGYVWGILSVVLTLSIFFFAGR